MKILFNEKFYNSDYATDSAAEPGRMEAIIDAVRAHSDYHIIQNSPADYKDILRAHGRQYIESVQQNKALYEMALLAAGGAVQAAEIALHTTPAFACIRPPGHHAYRNSGWGFCHFCNIAIALQKLKSDGKISSAFILDFDAHTGDGTRDCLSDWAGIKILNPMAEDNKRYLKLIEDYIKQIDYIDIIAVSAGFDSYVKDCGRKLERFDFYQIGRLMKSFSKRMGHRRRFAVLEGGYYLPDLGKNVVAFCDGFK